MLILDLTSGRFTEPDPDQQDNYPDQVLDSEWNPVLAEIQSAQNSCQETVNPASAVIDAALESLKDT